MCAFGPIPPPALGPSFGLGRSLQPLPGPLCFAVTLEPAPEVGELVLDGGCALHFNSSPRKPSARMKPTDVSAIVRTWPLAL